MAGQRLQVARVWLVVAATTALSVLTGLLVWAGFSSGCDGRLRLMVTAAPEIAPAVREAAELWIRRGVRVDGRCLTLRVTATDPARLAAALSARAGDHLDLAGAEPVGSPLPHVWIPDSSTWITRVRGVDRDAVRPDLSPIAMSAVVLAIPVPAARAQGWPAARIGWEYVLGGLRDRPPLPVGLVEPRRSAVGLAALLITEQLTGSTEVQRAYRELSRVRSATAGELRSRMTPGDATGGRLRAAFLTERDVHRYDADHPEDPVAAVYPQPAVPALDYPYAALAGLSADEAEAAGSFRRWLRGGHARRVLTRHGFRTPDGAVGPDFPTGHGVSPEPVSPPRTVPRDAIDRALYLWSRLAASSRAD